MRLVSSLLACTHLAAPAIGQCYDIPDGNTGAGNCIIVPFGDLDPQSAFWSIQIQQQLATAADLRGQKGLVTGLSFAPCGSGVRHFDRVIIRMGHCNVGTLTTTFANNFTSPAQTVLDVRGFRCPNVGNVWNRIPLETPFLYQPALGDLLIEMQCEGVGMPVGTAGMHAGGRQRVNARSWTTPTPPATGTYSTSNGVKMQICIGAASTSTFGAGCQGSNQQAPALDYTGSSQLGQTLTIGVSRVAGVAPFTVILGGTMAAPYPVALDAFGMPGCKLYTNHIVSFGGATNLNGAGAIPLAVPNVPALLGATLFNQAAVLDLPANSLGVTTSNAGQFVIGT